METLKLTHGQHKSPEDGMCLMEAVSFIAGEGHSDQPECACPVLSAYGRVINDSMGKGPGGDALRAKYLAPLAAKLVGTRSTSEVGQKRALFFADRAVRLFAPVALESAGLTDEAVSLRGLPEIVDKKTARTAADAAWVARASAASEAAAGAADAAAAGGAAAYAASEAASAAADAAYAAYAAYAASEAASADDAVWEQATQVLAEACEIKPDGGE